jgi:thymidylate synthase (FAD)
MENEMNIKLISYSQHAIEPSDQDEFEFELPNLQDLVAYCARVSNPSNQANSETSERLIKYLIKHKHWSPLEMVSVCIEVETTRDIARQLLRHRSFSFQEFSQRYADPTAELDDAFVLREARMQDTKNRQNSVEIDMSDEKQKLLAYEWERAQKRVLYVVKKEYEWAIKNGIAKEQARAVLPEGLTLSRLYVSGTLRSWIHYIDLRDGNGTQKEHAEIARACAEVIAKVFPIIKSIREGI